MAPDAKPVVFLGPTLSLAEAGFILDANYLPPVAQGDVIRAVQDYAPSCIVIIDGAFQAVPAVRHREILWALYKGVPVLGAASMGALRAAELHRHGMIGVGVIYRWYRRFAFAPDDAVAVLHGPQEFGSQPLTIAHVDLRKTLRKAKRNGLIDDELRRRLETMARGLHYRERTWDAIVRETFADQPECRQALQENMLASYTSQKKLDAVAALRRVANAADHSPRTPLTTSFRMTSLFLRDLNHARLRID